MSKESDEKLQNVLLKWLVDGKKSKGLPMNRVKG